MPVALLPIILWLSHYFLRVKIFKIGKEELWGQGKKVALWGNGILAIIFIVILIVLMASGISDWEIKKWFWMSVILASLGFQAFVEWKYLKGSKQYWVSFIVCILGEVLVFFLF